MWCTACNCSGETAGSSLSEKSAQLSLPSDSAALISTLRALLDSAEIPGLSLAVIRDGRVVFQRGIGVRRAGTSAAVDEHTVYEAASLSKPVVALTVMRLAGRGVIDLDRPLAAYLPLRELAGDRRAERITARMVLGHSTGLPNQLPPGDSLRLSFEPGSQFQYSGEGFQYLQRVLEQLTQRTLADLVRVEVFEPLGMARSSFVWEERFAANAAIGHGGGLLPRTPGRPHSARAPSSLHTTASDYARLLVELIRAASTGDRTVAAMLSPQTPVDTTVSWGLGWALERQGGGEPVFWHWGDNSNTGFTAFALSSAGDRYGVVWLANSDGGLSIAERLLALTAPGNHPASGWIGHERYDDPRRLARDMIDRVMITEGLSRGLQTYDSLKRQSGTARIDERTLNTLGYRLLERGRVGDAIAVFRANVREYPGSANVYDSLGEAYAVAGDTVRAIANYQRSVALNPGNLHARRVLRQLRRM
jgi:CubicO group peptidase (beta-lactamase class C family)